MTSKKKTTRKSVPAPDSLAARAQQATDLRYGPEVSALQQLGADARSSYLAGAGQARAAADSIVAATNESSGGLADFLKRAGARNDQLMARIGPVAAGLTNEGQLAARNHGLDVQSVAASLANAKLRAQEAGSYQGQRLYSQYKTDTDKINAQAGSLAGQAGQYAQSVYQSLLDDKHKSDAEAKKFAADQKNAVLGRATSRLVAGVDINGQVIPGSPKDVTAKASAAAAAKKTKDAATAKRQAAAAAKLLTPNEQNAYIGNIKTVAAMLKHQFGAVVPPDLQKLDKNGKVVAARPAIVLPNGVALKAGAHFTPAQMRQLLTTTNNPLKRAFDKDTINAAMDIAMLGGLSPANVTAVHAAGVKVNGRLPSLHGKKPPSVGKIIAGAGKPGKF